MACEKAALTSAALAELMPTPLIAHVPCLFPFGRADVTAARPSKLVKMAHFMVCVWDSKWSTLVSAVRVNYTVIFGSHLELQIREYLLIQTSHIVDAMKPSDC